MINCRCYYGVIFCNSGGKRISVKVCEHPSEIKEFDDNSNKYSHWPEHCIKFNFCPKCGRKLD